MVLQLTMINSNVIKERKSNLDIHTKSSNKSWKFKTVSRKYHWKNDYFKTLLTENTNLKQFQRNHKNHDEVQTERYPHRQSNQTISRTESRRWLHTDNTHTQPNWRYHKDGINALEKGENGITNRNSITKTFKTTVVEMRKVSITHTQKYSVMHAKRS